jgi:hypothetical protein
VEYGWLHLFRVAQDGGVYRWEGTGRWQPDELDAG